MRYNIFSRAHLPLKTALLSGCISFNKIVDQGSDSAKEVAGIVSKISNIYNEQIHYEALHVLPLIFEYEPSIANNYTTEHSKIAREARDLSLALQTFQLQQRNEYLATIVNQYSVFVLINYNHMDDEEAVLNEILWRYYSDNVLKQTEDKMNILPHLIQTYSEKSDFRIASAA